MAKQQKTQNARSNRRVILALAVALAAAATGAVWFRNTGTGEGTGQTGAPAFVDPQDAELVALGRVVYADNCAGCHGVNLEGAPDWRTRNADGTFPAPPHDGTAHTWHHPDAMLLDITRLGGQVFMPAEFRSAMPAFGEALSEREIIASLAYIKSFWPEKILARQKNITMRSQ